jgi:hypothetical protein
VDSLTRTAFGKGHFANRARAFANRAARTPAFPTLELICLAVAGLAVIAGAFGTATLPLARRAVFWLVLMGWNAVKWRAWFAWMVRDNAHWARASALGAVLLNLLLPFEIRAGMRLVGVNGEVGHALVWIEALAISAILAVLIWALKRMRARRMRATRTEPGPLVRAGARLEQVCAVRAEDHYCRLHFADGSSRLILCRFGDALAELEDFDGERIHRSAWVAERAVARAERDGRAWRLVVAGERFPVSAGHVAIARRRGWLNRR